MYWPPATASYPGVFNNEAVDPSFGVSSPILLDQITPGGTSVYRAVAQLDAQGHFQFTRTNAYSGNNGRAAILNDSHGADVYYAAGNAGNGSDPEPTGVIAGAGAQLIRPSASIDNRI